MKLAAIALLAQPSPKRATSKGMLRYTAHLPAAPYDCSDQFGTPMTDPLAQGPEPRSEVRYDPATVKAELTRKMLMGIQRPEVLQASPSTLLIRICINVAFAFTLFATGGVLCGALACIYIVYAWFGRRREVATVWAYGMVRQEKLCEQVVEIEASLQGLRGQQ